VAVYVDMRNLLGYPTRLYDYRRIVVARRQVVDGKLARQHTHKEYLELEKRQNDNHT
jgi:hypothetical protein